jgi:hypothetical protein
MLVKDIGVLWLVDGRLIGIVLVGIVGVVGVTWIRSASGVLASPWGIRRRNRIRRWAVGPVAIPR